MTVFTLRDLLLSLVTSALLLFPTTPEAQETSPGPLVAPSGRATTSVVFNGRLLDGATGWFNGSTVSNWSSVMAIDYGQPHVRGRAIFGGLVPYDEVWRLGANWATSLSLDVNMTIGDLDVPRGLYTLFLLPRGNSAELIVNRQTKQWGGRRSAAGRYQRPPKVSSSPWNQCFLRKPASFPPAPSESPGVMSSSPQTGASFGPKVEPGCHRDDRPVQAHTRAE